MRKTALPNRNLSVNHRTNFCRIYQTRRVTPATKPFSTVWHWEVIALQDEPLMILASDALP
jgi:hypothetical protein